jgi:hypothetical protein
LGGRHTPAIASAHCIKSVRAQGQFVSLQGWPRT